MKTALQSLKDHRATFWQATDCNAWMAAEAQLLAYAARQSGNVYEPWVRNHEDYSRQIMGVTHQDQFYA